MSNLFLLSAVLAGLRLRTAQRLAAWLIKDGRQWARRAHTTRCALGPAPRPCVPYNDATYAAAPSAAIAPSETAVTT